MTTNDNDKKTELFDKNIADKGLAEKYRLTDGEFETSYDRYPKHCGLCGGDVKFANNKAVYGTKIGNGYIYLCKKCGAYVGTYRPNSRVAIGVLSNKVMRNLKMDCHKLFDHMDFDGRTIDRRYSWFQRTLNIPSLQCRFGYFELDTLVTVRDFLVECYEANGVELPKLIEE